MAEHEAIDMRKVYAHVSALSDAQLQALERGPRTEDTECAICRAFDFRQFKDDDGDEHARWIVNFHGMDAMRCGIVYGMALAVRDGRRLVHLARTSRNPERPGASE